MKKTLIYIAILSLGSVVACSGPKGDKAKIADADTITANIEGADKYVVDTAASLVEWKGYKPTGEHNGTLKVKSGSLYIKENTPVGGDFVIDMKSLKNLDLTDPEWNGKLTGHLRSADFFNVDSFPEANFVVTQIVRNKTGAPAYFLTGNLTVKGISKSITFGADVTATAETFTASAPQFTVDRTEFDIRYKSNKFFTDLKDEFINDEFGLAIKLSGSKAK